MRNSWALLFIVARSVNAEHMTGAPLGQERPLGSRKYNTINPTFNEETKSFVYNFLECVFYPILHAHITSCFTTKDQFGNLLFALAKGDWRYITFEVHSLLEIIYKIMFLGVASFYAAAILVLIPSSTLACRRKKKTHFADHHSLSNSFTTLKESEQSELHGNLMPIYEWDTNIHIIVVFYRFPGHLFCSKTCPWAPSWPAWWRRCLARHTRCQTGMYVLDFLLDLLVPTILPEEASWPLTHMHGHVPV